MIIAVDLLPISPIEGAFIIDNSDFTHSATQEEVLTYLGNRRADLVMSDMAPNASGIRSMDHDNIVLLARTALGFAKSILCPRGAFLCKLWDGHGTGDLKRELATVFDTVRIIRPDASRKESAEIYLLGKGYHQTASKPS